MTTQQPMMETALSFYKRYLNNRRETSPLEDAFLSVGNIQFIIRKIEDSLKTLTNKNVRVPFNNELMHVLFDIVSRNTAYADQVAVGLPLMNKMAIEHETDIQYNSLLRRDLYHKFFITGDRMRVFPRAVGTKAIRGETEVGFSGYQTTNPWGRQHQNLLNEVYCVNQRSDYAEWPTIEPSGCQHGHTIE